jgi:rhodanese-related sulfurtransferase
MRILLKPILALMFVTLSFSIGYAATPDTIPGTTKVTAEGVIDALDKHADLVIIDARKASDRAQGYIEGSVGLPDTDTTKKSLAQAVPGKNHPVLFYCNGPSCGRSVKSAKNAVAWGYTNIYWFRGGWEEWTEKGLPVTK